MTDTVAIGAGTRHAEVIAGLENIAAFLETHLDLPLASGPNPFDVHVRYGSDEDNRAEIDRIAAILGVTAGDRLGGGTHYEARRDFGGGVIYQATAISRSYGDRYDAHMAPFLAAVAA